MISRIRKAMAEREEGFTLIELLVVIIIIGILAAIAIPVFLNQRRKGYDSAAKSDLRNAAVIQETYQDDYETYATLTQLEAVPYGFKKSGVKMTFLVVARSDNRYCMSAKHAQSDNTFYLASDVGTVGKVVCS